MIELTEEQQQELDEAKPARARDPRNNDTYVLVPTEVYERMRAIIDGYTCRAGWDEANWMSTSAAGRTHDWDYGMDFGGFHAPSQITDWPAAISFFSNF